MTTAHRLYAYGTLQVPEIFRRIVGRSLPSHPARLEGYARYRVCDRVYPAIVEQPGGCVTGVVYSGLERAELERLDWYEGDLYERRSLWLWQEKSQVNAQVYVLSHAHRDQLSTLPWDLETFNREHLASYLERVSVTLRAP
jgi:gamma-glutamyl AIG2-like cyclotransferase